MSGEKGGVNEAVRKLTQASCTYYLKGACGYSDHRIGQPEMTADIRIIAQRVQGWVQAATATRSSYRLLFAPIRLCTRQRASYHTVLAPSIVTPISQG